MKKYIILLMLSVATFAQTNPTSFNKIKVMNSTKDNAATRVVVQDSITKELKWVLKSSISIPHLEFNNTDKTVWNNGQSNITTNTSFGQLALSSNTTGSTLSAYGFGSLGNNTTGESNSGFGQLSLSYNQSGSFNTGAGFQAGQLYGVSTINTNPNNSTYLGAKTRASAANMTNETVIGYDATGKGNNTIQLGNASVTDLYTSAKITASPATLSTHLVTKGQLDAKATNISIGNKNANTFDIVSSSGTGATAPSATITEAGLMTAGDKVALYEKANKNGDNAVGSWGINISGNASKWGNISQSASIISLGYLLATEPTGNISGYVTESAVKNWLGLGSNAYTSTAYLLLSGGAITGITTAPTATLGTNTTQLATTAFVLANSYSRPYKVYTALLTQSGTSAPVATVLENTLGGTVVWSRTSIGLYVGTLNSAFVLNKTSCSPIQPSTYNGLTNVQRASANTIEVRTLDSDGLTSVDNYILNSMIEIRVYK